MECGVWSVEVCCRAQKNRRVCAGRWNKKIPTATREKWGSPMMGIEGAANRTGSVSEKNPNGNYKFAYYLAPQPSGTPPGNTHQ